MQLQMRHDPKSEMCNKLEDVHLRKLRQVFREYDCVPLPRPVDSEASLQEVDQMEFSELKTNFVEEFYILDRLVFKHAMTPPSIGMNQINGAVLVDLIVKYTDQIATKSGLLMSISEIPTQVFEI